MRSFRPRLESLEERVQPGDTILGLSLVGLGGLGFSAWDTPLAIPPVEHDSAKQHGLFSRSDDAGSFIPLSVSDASRRNGAASEAGSQSAVSEAPAETAGGLALSNLAGADALTGSMAVDPLAGAAFSLPQALPGGPGVTGAEHWGLELEGSAPYASFAMPGHAEPAGRLRELLAAAPALSFDTATGQLAIRTDAGQHTVREALTADGFVDVTVDGQHHSGNPHVTAFDNTLAGATATTLAGIRFDGGAADTLILGSQRLMGGLTVQASGSTLITENVVTGGSLAVQAGNITVSAAVRGSNVSLAAAGWVNVTAAGQIDAEQAAAGDRIGVVAGRFVNSGQLHADGPVGGQILVQANNVLNAGPVTADSTAPGGNGGQVQFAFTSAYVATTAAVVSASSAAGPGGSVIIDGGGTGHLFSSGSHRVTGSVGGAVDLFGKDIVLSGATVDASGQVGGGSVRIGGEVQGRDVAASNTSTVTVTPASTIRADVLQSGDGGRVSVWADQSTVFAGTVSARGGLAGGSGGFIDVSGHGDVSYGGSADAGARLGKSGTLLLDPKNLTVSDAPAGVFPQFDLIDPHPTAGGTFGSQVSVLSNGNVVVTNPKDDFGGPSAGAAYLFDGLSGVLFSSLVGSNFNDQVGTGLTLLSNGNYLVQSGGWNNDRGAVTWANGNTGVSGMVSDANSLIGSTPGDQVGSGLYGGVALLSNGNYVVDSPSWNGKRGAVTWANGNTGISGIVSDANSLVGSNSENTYDRNFGDSVGLEGVIPLSNGNYLVDSDVWNNGYGAVTWGNGSTGVSGTVSERNSLVGSNSGDAVGFSGTSGPSVIRLSNGNYLVESPRWNDSRGAVTWGNGSTGVSGPVSEANSLVGSDPGDQVGFSAGEFTLSNSVPALSNDNYLVLSDLWNNNRGAVTWGNGSTGISGTISDANSLVGSNPGDEVGFAVLGLSNGNYVVDSPKWNSQRGAVTWGNGNTGVSGTVSDANSLIGSDPGDLVGGFTQSIDTLTSVTPLSNGNYVVLSPNWNSQRGAATWGNGSTGISGTVSDGNSLVGSNPGDQITNVGPSAGPRITPLSNGNFVIQSPAWNDKHGAVTWINGSTGIRGIISDTNSLVGTNPNDQVGGVISLSNGNYVVVSPYWNDNRGAATWGNGSSGSSGIVSEANSLVGSNPGDEVGSYGDTPLHNGNYVIGSPLWNDQRGAVSWGNGNTGITGAVSDANSLVGSNSGDHVGLSIAPLSNGNYVVLIPDWNGQRGAVTWGNGSTGVSGIISNVNSLVGSAPGEQVGYYRIIPLSNGNYLVPSPNWNGKRGAVTWGSGSTALSGDISDANSLVGSNPNDQVGFALGGLGVAPLSNGNYLVETPNWNDTRGAVTWGNGNTGVSGTISDANSLVGSNPGDLVGGNNKLYPGDRLHSPYLYVASNVSLLSNGNYVVESPNWNGKRGAVTWGNGSTGISGTVSEANSLVGSNPGDLVGAIPSGSFQGTDLSTTDVTFLSNSDYVVLSPNWSGQRGAVTWVSGTSGQTLDGLSTITPQNSLVGTFATVGPGNIIENPAHQTFLVTSATAAGGRVTAGFTDPNRLSYATAQSQSLTITPAFLTRTLNTGTAITLQASNDITVNSPITVSAGGNGGALTLQAGRSILLNASITTDNGALTLIANDAFANGVVDAERDAGPAVISMVPGTTLDTGSGALTVQLRDGAGLTNPDSGAITLQNVTAGSVSVLSNGPSAGSDISLGTVTTSGPQSYANPNGTTWVSGNLTTTDSPITFNDAVVLNAGLTLSMGSGTVNFVAGTVMPSPGTVTVAGGVALTGSSTWTATLNGTDPGSYSQLAVGGPINLGGSVLSLVLSFEPPVGSSFEILTNTGAWPISGTFNGLDEGSVFTQGGFQFQITYQGGTGGDSIVLTRLA